MMTAYPTKRYSADKIVFLGLFVLSLLIAHLIISSRAKVILTDPIELPHTGLSISMPNGNGWKTQGKWEYHGDSFSLASQFLILPTVKGTGIRCTYRLAAVDVTPEKRLEQKASELQATITDRGVFSAYGLDVRWAYIENPQIMLAGIVGTAVLPQGRVLDINILHQTIDSKSAREVFEKVVKSINFEDNKLLHAGAQIVREIKLTGIDYFLNRSKPQNFFLINNAKNKPIGFTTDVITHTADAHPNIQAASHLYYATKYSIEEISFLQSDNNLAGLKWKTETRGRQVTGGSEIVFDPNGLMTVTTFSHRTNKQLFRPTAAAIPEIFLEMLFTQMLYETRKKVIVDFIDPQGRIIPTLIERMDTKKENEVIFALEFLNDPALAQQIYLDNMGQIERSVLIHKKIVVNRVPAEDVIALFPQRAQYLLKQKNPFEQKTE